jgi:hypothetical protein
MFNNRQSFHGGILNLICACALCIHHLLSCFIPPLSCMFSNDYNFKTNKKNLLSIFMQLMHMIVKIMPLSLQIVFAQGILLDHTF